MNGYGLDGVPVLQIGTHWGEWSADVLRDRSRVHPGTVTGVYLDGVMIGKATRGTPQPLYDGRQMRLSAQHDSRSANISTTTTTRSHFWRLLEMLIFLFRWGKSVRFSQMK